MSKKIVYKLEQIRKFCKDSGLDIVEDFGGNFEYYWFIKELLYESTHHVNFSLMAFIENDGAIFFGKIETDQGTKICIINRNGSDDALNRIIPELKSLEGDWLFSDQETIKKIASRDDIKMFITGQYDWVGVASQGFIEIPGEMEIDSAQMVDFEELVNLCEMCYQAQYPGRKKAKSYFETVVEIAISEGRFFVIKNNSRIASFCEVLEEEHPKVLVISNLFTLPEFRSQGFSTRLVNKVVKNFFVEQGRFAAMKINISNGPSHSVARKNGFEKASTISHCSVNPSAEMKEVLKIIAV